MGSEAAQQYDAILLGAGAAGLFCAALAGERGRRVLLVDHNARPGRKILISGGGRANFTHLATRPENFLSANPHFAKSALARYTPHHFVELVERYGIRYHAKTPGQLFCDGPASQIVDMLLDLGARTGRVTLRLGNPVRAVEHAAGAFTVQLGGGGTATAPALVVATGGLSIPKLGATGLGYELARQWGLAVEPPRPALVPLVFSPGDAERFAGLSGVATQAVAAWGKHAFRGPVLWTHRGLSGPAILQISSYWQPGTPLTLDFAPSQEVFAPLRALTGQRDPGAALAGALPRRLAERLLPLLPLPNLRNAALAEAEAALHRWPLFPAGTEGFPKAEVTAGGISTAELDAKTMQATRRPGLFAIGEVVDVTGHLGGYNFQWAWASAAAAALAL